MKIESQDLDLETILSGRYYRIPRFQRPYSWEVTHIDQLWEDVTRTRGEDYFLGSMVVYATDRQHFNVVDGQQRLTSLTIFLCVIRDELTALGQDGLARGLHQFIIRNNRDNRLERVLQAESSFPFFAQQIQEFDKSSNRAPGREEKSLEAAYVRLSVLVKDHLKSANKDELTSEELLADKVALLKVLRDSLLQLKFILVTLENEDDAYLIFETLNTRGKDLAVSDLLKNHFSRLLKPPGTVDDFSLTWQRLLETVSLPDPASTPDSFLYHYWASRYQSVPLKKLFPELRGTITNKNARRYLNELLEDAQLYALIHAPEGALSAQDSPIEDALRALKLFRVSQPTPAVLSILRAWKNGTIKQKKCAETLRAIEGFHFFFTTVTSSRSSGGISSMYNAFAQRLAQTTDSNGAAREIRDFIQKLRDRRPSLESITPDWHYVLFTNELSKDRQLVRYILERLAQVAGVRFKEDPAQRNIEHIRPQSNAWPQLTTVGKTGNLLLIDSELNNKLGNRPFNEKRLLLIPYDVLPLDSAVHVSKVDDWNDFVISQRTEELAKLAFEKGWSF